MTPLELTAALIGRERMMAPGSRVLVAFSGGADSTALAILLRELGYEVVLGHVDHGMRADSDRDAAHCRKVAGRLGCEFLCRRVQVDPPGQAEARRVRYEALGAMAAQARAGRTATGHTMDDQAETVRLRLDRGGFGLGIPPVRGTIVRPLLDVRRRQTEQVCRDAGIGYVNDPSNLNPRYARVAVREGLAAVPETEVQRLLEIEREARRRAARTVQQVDGLWDREVSGAGGTLSVGRSCLRGAPGPVREQLIRRAAGELGVELSRRTVADVVRKVLPVTGARLALPEGFAVWSERDRVLFGRYPEARALPELTLPVPGTAVSSEWGLKFTLRVEAPPPGVPDCAGDRRTELADAGALGGVLTLRQWRAGDRFHPLGAGGSRKLQDFFIDAGVPRRARSEVPVLVSEGRIVWVAGHRLDDRFKLRPDTVRAVRMTVAPAARERVA